MRHIIYIALAIVALVIVFHAGRCSSNQPSSDTITIRHTDTIVVEKPRVVDSTVILTKVVRVPIYRTDTLALTDTVEVALPITQKVYADSTYKAWVSGYNPSLDSIEVYRQTIIHKVQTRHSRWSIGAHAGVGVTPKGVQPYIGIGVSYRLFELP